ncbi:MAG: 5-(carboxyamino)imidazole ribonucleotide synthase [bacterium]
MKVGILGGGQLGQMLARAAKDLGLDPLVLDPKPDAVAGRVADHLAADFEDEAALAEMATCDVVTYEFENVPAASVERLARSVEVHPSPASLTASCDRWIEKNLFRELGIPTAPFENVDSRVALDRAVAKRGLPAILKTRRFGYDGKGQSVLRSESDVASAWERLGDQAPLLLEGFVPFDREISLLAVRTREGRVETWSAAENWHVDGILHVSRAPAAELSPVLFARARGWVESLMTRLDYVGVLVVELFQTGDELLANEMACRVHNSGHWTIEGAQTSQFENHVRAVAGLPLGPTASKGHSAMINLVGSLPDLDALEPAPDLFVHVYGKSPAPGRKLGHVTLVADDRDALESRLQEVLARIGDRGAS